ncbi:hypothetical protein C8F04DRAFT_55534 [Mycena alexandri]|uniref:Uncharacterized protein n=1 Tax=Mycena alexandri TaxID=1745969 RepID=A0AAD6XF05_9AGAR|nr:hypothetical protein C8F04DRAFT_55534 [Mycena alexandri]
MNFSASICRRALQGVHWTQRRSFYSHEPFYRWHSPLPFRRHKARGRIKPFELPAGVTTLDPTKITSKQYFDISKSQLASQYRQIKRQNFVDPNQRQYGDEVPTADAKFPSDTKGFLYFYSPPDRNPMGGCLRFRLTDHPSSQGFLAGHDLLLPHGLPWELPIWEAVTWSGYQNILDVLTADGFAPPMLQVACKSLNVWRDSVFISALGQPWVVNWATEFSRIYVIRPFLHPVPTLIQHPWFHYRRGGSRKAPYSGRGIVSIIKTPDGELALRVEKVLSLIQHSINRHTVKPVEGAATELVARLFQKSTKISELKAFQTVTHALPPIERLPWARADASPLKVYRHPPQPVLKTVMKSLEPDLAPESGRLPPLAIRSSQEHERRRAIAMGIPHPDTVPARDLPREALKRSPPPPPPVEPPPPTWDRLMEWNPPADTITSPSVRIQSFPLPPEAPPPHRAYEEHEQYLSWYGLQPQALQDGAGPDALQEPPPHHASNQLPHAQTPADGQSVTGPWYPNARELPPHPAYSQLPHAQVPADGRTEMPRLRPRPPPPPPRYGAAAGGLHPPSWAPNAPPPRR